DVVCGHHEPVTAADPHSHTFLPEMAAVAWSMGLPRRYLPICEQDGAYYCISQDGTVLFWDESLSDETWDSIWEWARDIWLADWLPVVLRPVASFGDTHPVQRHTRDRVDTRDAQNQLQHFRASAQSRLHSAGNEP